MSELENIIQIIGNMLADSVYMSVALAGFGVLLINLLKWLLPKLPFEVYVSGATLTALVNIGLVGVLFIAKYFGYGDGFEDVIAFINEAVLALLPLFGASAVATGVYRISAKNAIPLFGYQRTPEASG